MTHDYSPENTFQVNPKLGNSDNLTHVPWKQFLGVTCVCLALLALGGIYLVPAVILVFSDAWTAGITRVKGLRTFPNLSPMVWSVCVGCLFIIGFPCYLYYRNKVKTKPGNLLSFISVIITGTLGFLVQATLFISFRYNVL